MTVPNGSALAINSRTGTPVPSVVGVQSVVSKGSKGSKGSSATTKPASIVAPSPTATGDVVIEMDGGPQVGFKPSAPGSPSHQSVTTLPASTHDGQPLITTTGDPEAITPASPDIKPATKLDQMQPPAVPKKKWTHKRKEQIADLDWWSKYYVSKDDMSKVRY